MLNLKPSATGKKFDENLEKLRQLVEGTTVRITISKGEDYTKYIQVIVDRLPKEMVSIVLGFLDQMESVAEQVREEHTIRLVKDGKRVEKKAEE